MNIWKWNIAKSLWIYSATGATRTAVDMDTTRCDRIGYLEADIAALRARAESALDRDVEDLAQFILKRTDEIKDEKSIQEVMNALLDAINDAIKFVGDKTWPEVES